MTQPGSHGGAHRTRGTDTARSTTLRVNTVEVPLDELIIGMVSFALAFTLVSLMIALTLAAIVLAFRPVIAARRGNVVSPPSGNGPVSG